MWGVVVLGLAAAVIYGVSDYLGGWAARGLPSSQVSAIAFAAGLPVAALAVAAIGATWGAGVVCFGVLAGAAAASSIWLLYACLAIGPVGVLAPLVAVLASLVPVVYGLAVGHEHLGLPGMVSLAVVIASAAALSLEADPTAGRLTPRALGLGVAAGLATGAYLVALSATPASSGAGPVVVIFATGTLFLTAVRRLVRVVTPGGASRPDNARQVNAPSRWAKPAALISGATQATADVLAVVGIHAGHLAVMAALVVVTGERPHRRQLAAIAVALAASAVLATN